MKELELSKEKTKLNETICNIDLDFIQQIILKF